MITDTLAQGYRYDCSALTRAGSDGVEERKFLSFLCDAKRQNNQKTLVPFYA